VSLSVGDQVLMTAGAHSAVVDELVDLHAARQAGGWSADQAARYQELRASEQDLRHRHARALRRFLAMRRHRVDLDHLDVEPDEATMAVVAHGMLGSLGVITGAATMLLGRGDSLPETKKVELLEMIREQAEHLGGVLQDIVRGLPPALRTGLDQVSQGANGSRAV
jgi:hypothetical protein